jgi:hypothetical protein
MMTRLAKFMQALRDISAGCYILAGVFTIVGVILAGFRYYPTVMVVTMIVSILLYCAHGLGVVWRLRKTKCKHMTPPLI